MEQDLKGLWVLSWLVLLAVGGARRLQGRTPGVLGQKYRLFFLFEALDIPHLIEELRDLGNTLKNALESDLCQILLHRLIPRSSHKLRARAEEPCAV